MPIAVDLPNSYGRERCAAALAWAQHQQLWHAYPEDRDAAIAAVTLLQAVHQAAYGLADGTIATSPFSLARF